MRPSPRLTPAGDVTQVRDDVKSDVTTAVSQSATTTNRQAGRRRSFDIDGDVIAGSIRGISSVNVLNLAIHTSLSTTERTPLRPRFPVYSYRRSAVERPFGLVTCRGTAQLFIVSVR